MTKQVGMKMWYSENTSFLLVGISSLYLWVFLIQSHLFFLSHLQNCVTTPAPMPWADASQAKIMGCTVPKCTRVCENNSYFFEDFKASLSYFPHFHCTELYNKLYSGAKIFADLGGNINNRMTGLDKISVMIGH